MPYPTRTQAHAGKLGAFLFGNALDGARQIENMLYPRLVALNTQHLSVKGSSFSEKGMFSSDPRDKLSKEGSGRVGVFLTTDCCHCYTLEVNYHTGKTVNVIPPEAPFAGGGSSSNGSGSGGVVAAAAAAAAAAADSRTGAPLPTHSSGSSNTPPVYTPADFEDIGRALVLAALDQSGATSGSRLQASEYETLEKARAVVARDILASRAKKRSSSDVDPAAASGDDPVAKVAKIAMPKRVKAALQKSYKSSKKGAMGASTLGGRAGTTRSGVRGCASGSGGTSTRFKGRAAGSGYSPPCRAVAQSATTADNRE